MGKIAGNMPTLLILSKEQQRYQSVIEAENLPELKILETPTTYGDIVLGEPDLIRAALSGLKEVQWVQATWAGVEPLLDPSLRRDYVLTNARGVFGGLMSEYIFGYLLAHERKIFSRMEAQKLKQWDISLTGTLCGKTIGLLGVGSIGVDVARAAKFFGMRVRGYTRASETSVDVDEYFHPTRSTGSPIDQQQGAGLHNFAEGLDYLVSILPNTKETQKIIDANILGALPSHALFVNVGRGSAVDETALIDALEQNKIAGAVLDVFEQEPLPNDHPFWTTKNLTMTFHTSAPSLPEDIARVFIENYHLFIKSQALKYQVDFEKGY